MCYYIRMTTETTNAARTNEIANAFHARLAEINLSDVPVSDLSRDATRKDQAAAARKLFKGRPKCSPGSSRSCPRREWKSRCSPSSWESGWRRQLRGLSASVDAWTYSRRSGRFGAAGRTGFFFVAGMW